MKKRARATTPYMPRVLEAIDKKDFTTAVRAIQDSAIDYFNRFQKAAETIPVADAPLLIHLYRHMANELARADPVAKELAKLLEPIELPPIEYNRRSR